jgi:hypothetical protein
MTLLQRSYSGQSFRPKPIIEELRTHIAGAEAHTTLFVTSWSEAAHARLVIETYKEVLSLSSEPNSKEFGPPLDSLGAVGNRLRMAAFMANKSICTTENEAAYNAAVELTAISVFRNSIFWAQVGCPHLLLINDKGFQPLCYQPDWSGQIQQSAPLVCSALGLDFAVQLNCGSYRKQNSEKLVLVARSSLPSTFYSVTDISLDSLSQSLVEENPDMPFWLGILK